MIFTDTDTAVREHPESAARVLRQDHPTDGQQIRRARTRAVWSGGSFIYVPPGVKIDFPLQAYFRINAENMGQFERTLIIVDEGAQVHYVEGCTAPMYTSESLHSAVVEVIVKKNARCRYTTIQNWANNIYNLVTKRAFAYQDAVMEWVDGNLGSQADDEVPGGLHDGTGCSRRDPVDRVLEQGPTSGRRCQTGSLCSQYDGHDHFQVDFEKRRPQQLSRFGADRKRCDQFQVQVVCDALILDAESRSDTYPYIEITEQDVSMGHEASVSRIGEEQLFYLMSRGLIGSRSQHDDRQRIHRAAGQRAADGIRRRNEPLDPTADGRLGRLARSGFGACDAADADTTMLP